MGFKMPYEFEVNKMYRMPTHFGPSLGPRQGVEGRKYQNMDSPKVTSLAVSFLTREEQFDLLLPPGFEVDTEPVVTLRASYITEIEWLAGRGYNTLGVSFPAIFEGREDHINGDFLLVLWENLTDPILTGREELGFSKIYCELPEPRFLQGNSHCIASWLDFKFMDLKLWNLTQASKTELDEYLNQQRTSTGLLHYKYMPKTEDWGNPDIAYATFTPYGSNQIITELWRGKGSVKFHEATWEDLPTMVNIVNTFYTLEILEYREAEMVKSVGGKDLSDQRILR